MNINTHTKQMEIEENLKFFLTKLSGLKKAHAGKYVLLRSCEIVGIYDTVTDANITGVKFFEDGMFSIQKVDDTPINLGFFSYAMPLVAAQ